MYKILSLLLVAFCLILFTQVTPSQALLIPGPVLDQNQSGHSDFGLIIRAEQNTNLVSVRYPNQGQADVIELRLHSDGTLLTSIPTPAANTDIVVNINYPLTAGGTYRLIATTPSNGKFTIYNNFPAGNSEIAVLSSFFGSSEYNIYWASFNDITTESASPTYTVTYNGNENTGGSVPVDANTPYEAGFEVIVIGAGDLVRNGFTFKNWNTQADGGGTSYAPGGTFTINDNIILYAQWTAASPAAIPTLSEWGMIIMSLILAGSAIWMMRRRQVS